ncbi:hypothetical protein Ddye_000963 [Dipteronia dyeriana]|uniref:Endonuclease/exonuclease/phosphatase domain-containing protein n=1 Tax=Dipteronia dyeriana TaxID=168575 RepID=A0AAD9XMN6_9ROSI|nr:hypothetical protein Ddye_000963 [Dipteronia dyeriana]
MFEGGCFGRWSRIGNASKIREASRYLLSVWPFGTYGKGVPRTTIVAFRALLKYMQQYSPNIVFLMETRLNHVRMENLRIKLGFNGKLVVECEVVMSGGSRVHGHLDHEQRRHDWTLLKRLHGMYSLPLLCSRDFNEIISDDEKLGGPPRNRKLMENFGEAIDWCGLEDVNRGPIFTWCNKRDSVESVQERLDRGLCNHLWKQAFPNAFVNHLDFLHSYHCALLFVLAVKADDWQLRGSRNRRRFHFKAC